MMRSINSLASNERGNSVVELGLVAPILAALLIGMTDIAGAVAARLSLEQAAQRTIEKVMNGQSASLTTLSAEAVAAAGDGVTADDVTVTYWLECNGVSQLQSRATMVANFNQTCPAGQSYARYVEVIIEKDFAPTFGTRHFPGANADGTITLTGEAGLRIQQ